MFEQIYNVATHNPYQSCIWTSDLSTSIPIVLPNAVWMWLKRQELQVLQNGKAD